MGGNRAEDASVAASLGAQQLPIKLEARAREVEHELNRTVQMTAEFHKNITKGERRVKELMFQSEENKNNQDRIADLVEKLQQKIKSYKKQIEGAEEIAAINLAKYRKAQQELEEDLYCKGSLISWELSQMKLELVKSNFVITIS